MLQIETRRLRLRPITLDDLPALAHLWSDPELYIRVFSAWSAGGRR
jgi:RimJ/RimL family protein N-acetyltransferase